ncbi:hypothetical protein J7T55_007899 [Diaporthe amygdali]|uniref:uncharacterized protein n=1 Tax=Phomopsis amygdali TaxID=1214568 RepID=UPI0022FDB34C|nr:uncharacterized protein J7T55_007899 [Diaporthe amygdali]KAJ0114065.1 hypothetical protein J7T55_007899 [Diaporthe amygdali]
MYEANLAQFSQGLLSLGCGRQNRLKVASWDAICTSLEKIFVSPWHSQTSKHPLTLVATRGAALGPRLIAILKHQPIADIGV